ncbi:MAG: hypothetical protein DRP78_05685 [Candidatus Omnitrophota bacterium]|nr:MAG: hypothetical protein DRP78_05685 [Candidatus Omnitrophota bacterium]
MNHPLHFEIGNKLKKYNQLCDIILDTACGGNQNIPIFLEEEKAFETEVCNVDALFIKNNRIINIIEIEEANIKPIQICGKFLTSALGKFFIHKTFKNKRICYDNSVLFLHILDTSKLRKDKTKKFNQGLKIERKIQDLIKNDCWPSNIKEYALFFTKVDEKENQNKIVELIEKKIKTHNV